jgi:undecaprenyl-diphosphatase
MTEQSTVAPVEAGEPDHHDRSRWHLPRVRGRTFGPASEQPYRRRTSDWVRLTIATGLFVAACFHQGNPWDAEQDLFAFFNGLPDSLQSLFIAIYRLGALWAVGLVVAAALIGRRWRLARDLAIAGVAAWFLGRFIGELVAAHQSIGDGIKVITRLDDSPSFPLVRLAVITAVICAASPYLTRPTRRIGQTIVLVMALAALYLGTGLPDACFAAVVLGWGVAAAVHLAFGSPGGRPTREQVQAALQELGVTVHDLELAPYVPADGTVMRARDDGGYIHVRVLGRDEADAQLMSKFWRFVFYKDGGPSLHLTRLEDVEQEGFTLLLAERSGARVPSVLAVGSAGPSTALAATRIADAPTLADSDASVATDAFLRTLWKEVDLIHASRVAHGRLNARHILVTADGPAIIDFSHAQVSAADASRYADVAELLVSTAQIVGTKRAVSCAHDAIGSDELAASLPYLQPAALSREMRPHGRHDRKHLQDQLKELSSTIAEVANVEVPALQQLYRINTTNLLMAVGSLIAVFALLSQIGDPEEFWNTISSADWWWLALAMILSLSTNLATAVALMGTVPIPLPLWRTAELQLSMSFSNLAVPAVGGMAAQIRFLQRQGVDLASAVASGAVLSQAANIATYVVIFFIALALSPTDIHTGQIPVSSIASVLLIAVVVLVIAAAVVWFVPKVKAAVMPRLKSAAATIWGALRSPRRVFELIGGNALNAVLYAFVMQCCIEAFGGSINFWTVLALNILIGTIASLVPIPGGGTAVGSVGMSGALTAVGLSSEVAVAAVLADQLVANFIPALPGWLATKDLLSRDYL